MQKRFAIIATLMTILIFTFAVSVTLRYGDAAQGDSIQATIAQLNLHIENVAPPPTVPEPTTVNRIVETPDEATQATVAPTVSSYYLPDIPLDEALQEHTFTLCKTYEIPEHYATVLAVMWRESNYTPDAISGTNDYGIMQINSINNTWLYENLGLTDMLDPYQNIEAGVYYLSTYIKKYGDLHSALMCYNMGEGGASTAWQSGIYSTSYSRDIVVKAEEIKSSVYYNIY